MAFILCDSFDHYSTAQSIGKILIGSDGAYGSTITIDSGTGRRGTSSLKYYGTNYAYRHHWNLLPRVSPSGDTCIVGFALKVLSVPAFEVHPSSAFVVPSNGTTDHMKVLLTDAGAWELKLAPGDSTVVATSSGNPILSNTWHYVEIKWVIGNTGSVVIRVDEDEVLNYSGDTMNGSFATWTNVRFGGTYYYENSVDGTYWVDDLYLLDGSGGVNDDFLGDVAVNYVAPDSAGTTAQWARGGTDSGSNYGQVDENPPDGVSYVTAAAAGSTDLYNFPAIAAGALVPAVQSIAFVKQSGGGSAELAAVCKSGSTTYEQADPAGIAADSYRFVTFAWDTDPAGGSWSESSVNAAEFGIRKTV